MTEEMRKRLEEAAEKYAWSMWTNPMFLQEWNECKRDYIAGAEWMFKECGGMTVLHDMRRLILAQCKEWWKEKYYLFDHFDKDEVLADFEADMNKLWEGEK